MPRHRVFNSSTRVRKANFVCNNPTDADKKFLRDIVLGDIPLSQHNLRYLIYQMEEGTCVHLQGYAEFTKQVKPAGRTMHAETSPWHRFHWDFVDHPKKAIHYCRKPVDGCECPSCTKEREHPTRSIPHVGGSIGHAAQGRDDTIEDTVLQINCGTAISVIARQHPKIGFMYYDKIVSAVLRSKEPRQFCEVIYLEGPTGCGKSTWIREEIAKRFPGQGIYSAPLKTGHNGRWDCEGYEGQNHFVIDEFSDSMFSVDHFKTFFDKFPVTIESKGKSYKFKSNYIWLTSNRKISQWYSKYAGTGGDRSPLERRITDFFTIYDCKKNHLFGNHGGQTETGEYMLFTLRAHPVGGFKFDGVQTGNMYNII